MRVKIIGGGILGSHTKIVDVNTGEPLEGVFRVDYSSAVDNADTAIISLYVSEVEFEIDANVRKFCPYCKREVLLEESDPKGIKENEED